MPMRLANPDSLYLSPAMRLKNGLFLVFFIAVIFGCSPDPDKIVFDYSREPSYFRADTTQTDHPLCAQSPEIEDCASTKKYRLTWNRPDDTVNLLGYRIYLDSVPPNAPAGEKWDKIQTRSELASIIVERHAFFDSVVFAFGSPGFSQDTLRKGGDRIFLLDSVGREEVEDGKLVFGLVPIYRGDVVPGRAGIAWFVTKDKEPPLPFIPFFKAMAKSVSITWERPADPTSFFNPSLDTGIIVGYSLWVTAPGKLTPAQKRAFDPKILSYLVREKDLAGAAEASRTFDSLSMTYKFFLPDSGRASKRTSPTLQDSLKVLIGNLMPRDTLEIFLYAVDSSGNANNRGMERITLLTTDTTRPSRPVLSAVMDSITTNSFRVSWTASRDSVPGPEGSLVEAGSPNAYIHSYRLARLAIRDSNQNVAGLGRVDTVFELDSAARTLETFNYKSRFLPPGTAFRILLYAVDSSGFESAEDSLTIRTLPVRFAGTDSVLACPPGFVPIPGGSLKLGDDGSGSQDDEKPSRTLAISPFCIEPYEHRDTTSQRFVTNYTHKQAIQACEDLHPAFSTRLCSEAQWERACEGPDPEAPLLHGIQSEGSDPSILQISCNQATDDSIMAVTFSKRNPICLTTEGVYDMAGNLAEWVLDSYRPDAYDGISGDSLEYGYAYRYSDSLQDAVAPRGLRGGHYLKTGALRQAQTQNMARCSNRDFAQQVRPKFREDCKDSAEVKIALVFGPGLEGHDCVSIPPESGLDPSEISELKPAPKDTTNTSILALLHGKADPVTIKLDTNQLDSALRRKRPVSIHLTTRSLAIVEFENADGSISFPDTLDAKEMKDTTQAGLAKIFDREASNPEWTVKKENGKYKIRYAYAYAELGTKPAKQSHSSRVIGFRCCSMAMPAPAPPDSALAATP